MAYYMITIQPGTLMTAEEFISLPREDGWHYELAAGRLVRMPLAGYNHDVVVSRLAANLLPLWRSIIWESVHFRKQATS